MKKNKDNGDIYINVSKKPNLSIKGDLFRSILSNVSDEVWIKVFKGTSHFRRGGIFLSVYSNLKTAIDNGIRN